ncbi:mechanosensitive ion channel family protein [Coprobacter sp.]
MELKAENVIFWVSDWFNDTSLSPAFSLFFSRVIILATIFLLAIAADYLCRYFINSVVHRIVKSTKAEWDDLLFDRKLLNKLALTVPAVMIYFLIPLAFPEQPLALSWILKFCIVYIIAVVLRFFSSFLNILLELTNRKESLKDRPVKGLFQTLQVLLFFIGTILIISVVIDKSPWSLFAGLGASAAILMLVFKDTIMGFVSGIQLSANDMLRPGDWITVPRHGANGRVIEVTLNTVKVRNFDNTIITIPPYALVSDSFQNWRGMEESGGRRIKRAVHIDMNSVRFCTHEMLERFFQIDGIKEYVESRENLSGHLRLTNIGLFRAYLNKYIRTLPECNEDLMILVRYLEAADKGMPVEIYFFTADKEWVLYETLQADVLDHIMAILPEFDLRVFQSPSGADFRFLSGV